MRRFFFLFYALSFSLTGFTAAQAEPTEIAVHVLSKDAKFIGSSMGGMRITLRDAMTGEVLSTGVTSGGTGNTKLLMHEDGGRRAVMADGSAGGFHTVLNLEEPRLVEVEAVGPLAQLQGAHRLVSSQWVVPGKHITGGNGWMLELPGFVVDVLSPPAAVKLPKNTDTLELSANVMMMCGCHTEPGGIWNTDNYEIKAIVKRNGKKVDTVDMAYTGTRSQYKTSLDVATPGTYEVTVYAYDAANGNTGLDKTTFIILNK